MFLYIAIICFMQQILNIVVCYKILSFWIKPTWIKQSVMYGIPPYTSEKYNHSKYGVQPYVLPPSKYREPYVPFHTYYNYSKYDDWDSGEITWRDVINLTILNRTYTNYRF